MRTVQVKLDEIIPRQKSINKREIANVLSLRSKGTQKEKPSVSWFSQFRKKFTNQDMHVKNDYKFIHMLTTASTAYGVLWSRLQNHSISKAIITHSIQF